MQAALHAQVVGVVDDGLDPQGAAVLEVLLDSGVLVERVHGDLDPASDDLGLEDLRGHRCAAGPDPATGEDQLDLVGSADVEVVGYQGLENPRA